MSQFPATTNTSCYAVAFRFESLAGWSYFAIFNQNPSHSNHHIPDNLTISGHLLFMNFRVAAIAFHDFGVIGTIIST
jgi:hypothetical protein